jgi:hypothetical protein
MTRLSSSLSLAALLLTLSNAVAAEVVPVPKTPEQEIEARRMVITNSTSRSIHYRLDGLSLLDAIAYRRLEFTENEVERNRDEQGLNRLHIQNDTITAIRTPGGYRAPLQSGRNLGYSSGGDSTGAGPALMNLEELRRAYLEVLNMERARKGLPPVLGAVAPAAAAPQAVVPAVVTSAPAAPAAKPMTLESFTPEEMIARSNAIAKAITAQRDAVAKVLAARDDGVAKIAARDDGAAKPVAATIAPTAPLAPNGSSGGNFIVLEVGALIAFCSWAAFRCKATKSGRELSSRPDGIASIETGLYSSSVTGSRSSRIYIGRPLPFGKVLDGSIPRAW